MPDYLLSSLMFGLLTAAAASCHSCSCFFLLHFISIVEFSIFFLLYLSNWVYWINAYQLSHQKIDISCYFLVQQHKQFCVLCFLNHLIWPETGWINQQESHLKSADLCCIWISNTLLVCSGTWNSNLLLCLVMGTIPNQRLPLRKKWSKLEKFSTIKWWNGN